MYAMKFNDSTPIYLQIVEKIKADIVAGKLKGGDKLPSVREIAENFKVNPNTVQRVYMELEREGVAYPQRGIGTFISEGGELVQKLRSTQAYKYTRRYVGEMKELGMGKKEVIENVESVLEEDNNDHAEG
jgi:DNA-binding transcriptional regulator YhcF (GntR family)